MKGTVDNGRHNVNVKKWQTETHEGVWHPSSEKHSERGKRYKKGGRDDGASSFVDHPRQSETRWPGVMDMIPQERWCLWVVAKKNAKICGTVWRRCDVFWAHARQFTMCFLKCFLDCQMLAEHQNWVPWMQLAWPNDNGTHQSKRCKNPLRR